MKVINGKNLILGRLATYVAKQILLGQEIAVVNCEKIIISGNKKQVLARYVQKAQQGHPRWGPFYFTRPDRFVKRSIRGMVSRKKPRGRDAFKRVRCYIGLPEKFRESKIETLEKADAKKLPNLRYLEVGQICKNLGGKWQEK